MKVQCRWKSQLQWNMFVGTRNTLRFLPYIHPTLSEENVVNYIEANTLENTPSFLRLRARLLADSCESLVAVDLCSWVCGLTDLSVPPKDGAIVAILDWHRWQATFLRKGKSGENAMMGAKHSLCREDKIVTIFFCYKKDNKNIMEN